MTSRVRLIRVVIESPLSASTREGIEKNKEYARRAVRDSLRRGEAPYASHLFFDQPGILDDTIPAERELGMVAGFCWGEAADKVVVYQDHGISSGMRIGIDYAMARGLPVEYRRLDETLEFVE